MGVFCYRGLWLCKFFYMWCYWEVDTQCELVLFTRFQLVNRLTLNKINRISFVFTKMAVFLLAVCLHLAVGLGREYTMRMCVWIGFCNFAILQLCKFANTLSFPKISRQFFDCFTKSIDILNIFMVIYPKK